MSFNHGVSDLITRIRNAYLAGLLENYVLLSKINLSLLKILKEEGFIKDFSIAENRRFSIKIILKYNNGRPAVNDIKTFSKPGKRFYNKAKDIFKGYNGFAVPVLSTSKGIMTGKQARALNVGGEFLFYVF